MLYVLICKDQIDSEELRKKVRPDHLHYLQDFGIRLAGPILSDDQQTMVGSLILLECNNKEEAEAFASNDPYNTVGLYESVEISPYRQAIPQA